ncbi:MAG: SH3 domain-containing protein [Ardenticatenaceae bacterium]|nr:SH3 domain-containing protein [Ardenticatenaceae bacterium]
MKGFQFGRRHLLLFAAIVLVTIGVVLAACRSQAPIPLTGAAAEMAGAPLPVAGDVHAEYMTVSVALPGTASFARLPDDGWYQLLSGSLIATDDLGEAWLQLRTCPMLVYIFQNSGLVTSACSKAEQTSGNVTCSTQGTAAFRDECASKIVIQTPGAEVTLEGTWLTVTYLPDRQLTVVLVFDGKAAVQPVRNLAEHEDAPRDLGNPIMVKAQHFWFSTPGESADPIGGLAAREPHPFDRLPLVMQELGLERWMEKILERARMDNVLGDPSPFSPTPTISVTRTPSPTATATPTPTPEPPRLCTVVSRALNLRTGPGTNYSLIESLRRGTVLQALARNSDERWIVIVVPESDRQGWVFAGSEYIRCDFPIANLLAATPPPAPGIAAPPTPRPIPPPGVAFQATPLTLHSYQEPKCTTLRWNVVNAASVALDGQGVRHADSAQRCPEFSTTYTLLVQGLDGRYSSYSVSVTVIPDTTPPTVIRAEAIEAAGVVTITVEARDAESGLHRIDIRVNERHVGTCGASPCSVVIGPLEQGTYTYAADVYDRAGNQALSRPGTLVVGPRGLPDLVVSKFEVYPAEKRDAAGYLLVRTRVDVTNHGTSDAAPFEVSLRLSDATGSIFGDPATYAVSRPLAPGETWGEQFNLRIMLPAKGGSVWLQAQADSAHSVKEASEENNFSERRLIRTEPPPASPTPTDTPTAHTPDLVVRFTPGTPDKVGGNFIYVSVQVEVMNQGSADADKDFVVLFRAYDANGRSLRINDPDSFGVSSLPAGTSRSREFVLQIYVPPGFENVRLQAIADSTNSVSEENERNNSSDLRLVWTEQSGTSPMPMDTPGPTPSIELGPPTPTDTPVPVPTEASPSPVPIETSPPAPTETPAPLPAKPATPVPTAALPLLMTTAPSPPVATNTPVPEG